MTAPIFTWAADSAQTAEAQPRLRTAQFGDGYSEDAPDGIHNLPLTYTVSFTGRHGTGSPVVPSYMQEKDDIIAFLRERGGHKPFYFAITHDNRISLVKCRQWKKTRDDMTAWAIQATFVEAFSEPNVYQPSYDLYGNAFAMQAALQALEDFVNGPAGAL